jgi:hypothetical protein
MRVLKIDVPAIKGARIMKATTGVKTTITTRIIIISMVLLLIKATGPNGLTDTSENWVLSIGHICNQRATRLCSCKLTRKADFAE